MTRTFSRLAPIATCSIALLILLSGCSRQPQKNKSLDQLPKTNSFIAKNASIQGSYTVLDAKACKAYLGGNALKKGYQPLYITLSNNTNQVLYFDTNNMNISTAKPAEVATSMHTNPKARAIGLGIPGAMVVCPGITLLACPFLGAPLIFAPIVAVPTLALMGLSITPAIKSTKDAIKTNKNIDETCELKALHNQMIAPHTSVSGLIFVRKQDFNPNFEISLTDSLNRPLILASNPASATSVA